jgi:hypothetical protein
MSKGGEVPTRVSILYAIITIIIDAESQSLTQLASTTTPPPPYTLPPLLWAPPSYSTGPDRLQPACRSIDLEQHIYDDGYDDQ